MDSETIKELILEKIFDVFAPKLVGYYNVLNNTLTSSWHPNIYYIEERFRGTFEGFDINMHISIDGNGKFSNCHFTKFQREEYFNTLRRHALDVDVIPLIRIVLDFNNKTTAIRGICEHVSVGYVIQAAMCAIKEIEFTEGQENFSIGTIKKILELSPNIDLANLETRKILTEFIR